MRTQRARTRLRPPRRAPRAASFLVNTKAENGSTCNFAVSVDGWSISPSQHAKIGKRDTPGVTNTAPLKCLDARVQRVIASLPVARGESQTVNMLATGSENIVHTCKGARGISIFVNPCIYGLIAGIWYEPLDSI